jgi:hypothetical protein
MNIQKHVKTALPTGPEEDNLWELFQVSHDC